MYSYSSKLILFKGWLVKPARRHRKIQTKLTTQTKMNVHCDTWRMLKCVSYFRSPPNLKGLLSWKLYVPNGEIVRQIIGTMHKTGITSTDILSPSKTDISFSPTYLSAVLGQDHPTLAPTKVITSTGKRV